MKFLSLLVILVAGASAQLFISCETTSSGYGYVATALDDENIAALFELSDQAVNNGDYDLFKSLHAPKFTMRDESGRPTGYGMNKQWYSYSDYMEMARDFFRVASNVDIYTQITDVMVEDSGTMATVTVQEDMVMRVGGTKKRTITLAEVEVGFDDGWIFFEEWRDIAQRDVRE